MDPLLAFILGLIAGAGIAVVIFVVSRRKETPAADPEALAQSQQRASAAESVVAELRTQMAQASQDFAALRSALDSERQDKVKAQTQLAAGEKSLAEQKALLEQARQQLLDSFKALSSDALKSNNQSFLDLAHKAFQALLADARGDVAKRQEAIDAVIKPLTGSLERYEQHVKALEESRQKAYGSLEEQIRNMGLAQQQLQKEAAGLVTALRAPQVRGRWGEVTLHRVVELAGMSEHCDYSEQVSVDGDAEGKEGKLRPDMVVHLPAGRDIVVDSKCSLEAYLRAISADSEQERADCLRQHAQQIRTHMQKLSAKQYWDQFEHTPEFVVMFIPGESFFAAALDNDPTLLEDGMKSSVVLATPTTLIALLRAVAFGWRQEALAENARHISDLGKELYERIKVLASHLVSTRRALIQVNESFNKAVGSMESRVLPSVRKFQELGVAGGDPVPTLEPLDVTPRTLAAPDVSMECGGNDAALDQPPTGNA